MKTLGIDIGSMTTKAVLMENGQILSSVTLPSHDEAEASARAAATEALQAPLPENGLYIVTTGTGGKAVSFSRKQKAITTCLARGVSQLVPSARLVIDMGAESSTVLAVNERGRVTDWANHDKCAAGTGIFLEQMAKLMQLSMADMAELSFQATARADITNTCAVFAESEVISHVHRVPPTPRENIAAGIYYSVVSRIITLCKRVGIRKDVAVVGGVARNRGLVRVLEQELGFPVVVPENPHLVAALGAAIIAREEVERGASR